MGWVLNATPAVEAQSQYQLIISICVTMSALSVLVVCSRLWIRMTARGLAADDTMSGLSMVFALVYAALCIAQTRYGLGLPIKLRPKADLVTYTRVNFAGRPFYQLGISFFKVALLLSYLSLFKRTDRRIYRMVVIVAIGLVFLAHLGCTFALIFACNPVHKSWDPYAVGTCLASGPSFTGYAIVTILSDIAVAVIPLPVLLKLNVPRNKKIGLIALFLLGLFTTLCSIFRYLQINRIQHGDGNSTMLVLWGVIEFNVGNMISSLPFLAPMFIRKAKEYRSSKGNNPPYGTGGESSAHNKIKGDGYKLSDVSASRDTGAFVSSRNKETPRNGSEEGILRELKESEASHTAIVKSVSYTVQVNEDAEIARSMRPHALT